MGFAYTLDTQRQGGYWRKKHGLRAKLSLLREEYDSMSEWVPSKVYVPGTYTGTAALDIPVQRITYGSGGAGAVNNSYVIKVV